MFIVAISAFAVVSQILKELRICVELISTPNMLKVYSQYE